MDILSWLWWFLASLLQLLWSLVWFLISGWVSTILQILLAVFVIFYFKYGWQRAPAEILKQARALGRLVWGWMSARETAARSSEQAGSVKEVVRVVRVKDLGDVNISTLLSLSALAGIVLMSSIV